MAKTPSSAKIIRDPLYNYITIDRDRDRWLLDLIDTPEVQRLRRIHQLGVSHFTYPGADHSRLSHTLGVVHLMQVALRHIETLGAKGAQVERARHPLLAAALLHDVGHGPFSHLIEPVLEKKHEHWSCAVVSSPETQVNQVLKRHDIPIDQVVALIQKDNRERPPWQKALLSSELDVDRLDYLRRDSYFTGAGYGHFDWYRILNSFKLNETENGFDILVWPEKAKHAIEEYIFSRYYMYNNVYQHKTTRGFEKLVHSAWRRAEYLRSQGDKDAFLGEINEFLDGQSIDRYLAIDDALLVYQVKRWMSHGDEVLAELSKRFINRICMAVVEDPLAGVAFATSQARKEWEAKLQEVVRKAGFSDPEYFVLSDNLKLTVYDPYIPETEKGIQDPYNAIFVESESGEPREISGILDRLGPFTGARNEFYRYYVPRECRDEARKLIAAG